MLSPCRRLIVVIRTAASWIAGAAFVLAVATPAGARCLGDCSGDGAVTVDEVVSTAAIALGNEPLSDCTAGDGNADSRITVDEVLMAVDNAVKGCPTAGTPTTKPTQPELPPPTPTPPTGCGNGVVDFNLGETCDDGNTLDDCPVPYTMPCFDHCPYNCRIDTCTPSGVTLTADVSFTPPEGVSLSGITVFLRYPDGVVRIPGMGMDAQVQNRITNLPDNGYTIPNDLDYALRILISTTDGTSFATVAPGVLFSVEFDTCQGPALPSADDFSCTVGDAGDVNNQTVLGVSCGVTLH